MNFLWIRGGFIYLNLLILCELVVVLIWEDLDKFLLYLFVKKKKKKKLLMYINIIGCKF